MLFTVSLQLTKTGHLSTSPSSISLARMLTTPIISFLQSLSLPLPFGLSKLSLNFLYYPSLTHSPSPKLDEELSKISALSGLPHKVIKHWFRNTLFKERQRDKDSPYNFNNPPTTALQEELAQNQPLTLSPCSLSPGFPANSSPQPQTTDIQRGETHRGRRSSRTRFTEQQLETLQGVFEATPYPREEEYDRLSALLSLPNRVIVVWFQNARQRAQEEDGKNGIISLKWMEVFA
uniref:Homeobox domain-containing protein n=1 Tax=Monopterus albus TaxID=43700 RepID=A0A3Q3J0E4_MONAL